MKSWIAQHLRREKNETIGLPEENKNWYLIENASGIEI